MAQDPLAEILVVDDTPENLQFLSMMLNSGGYLARPVADGPAALAAAREKAPDIILLDISMPVMNGFEVCEALKADEGLSDIPVLFISAMDQTSDKVRAFQVGGVDFITKPFQPKEVLMRIHTHLTLYRQRVEIERLRERDRQTYENLSAIKDELMHTVSHDLKNPLGSIKLTLSLLGRRLENDEKGLSLLDRIEHDVERSLGLIANLLEIARIETGVACENPEGVPLNEALDEVLGDFKVVAEDRDITLHFSPTETEAKAYLERSRFVQVLSNLLSNAIKYTPPGGNVEVFAGQVNGGTVVRITDDGLGIPAADLPHIFDKFYRVQEDSHLAVEGTGLGLSIVKAIMEQCGGEVDVQSEKGVGTSFSLLLP